MVVIYWAIVAQPHSDLKYDQLRNSWDTAEIILHTMTSSQRKERVKISRITSFRLLFLASLTQHLTQHLFLFFCHTVTFSRYSENNQTLQRDICVASLDQIHGWWTPCIFLFSPSIFTPFWCDNLIFLRTHCPLQPENRLFGHQRTLAATTVGLWLAKTQESSEWRLNTPRADSCRD